MKLAVTLVKEKTGTSVFGVPAISGFLKNDELGHRSHESETLH